MNTTTIIHNRQTRIQISIISKHCFHYVIMERIVLEQSVIWFEIDKSTIFIIRFIGMITNLITFFKFYFTDFTFSIRANSKMGTQSINCFNTYTIQTDTLLKSLTIVFTTSIKYTDSFYKFTLRNTTSIITNRNTKIIFDIHLNAATSFHFKLVN